MKKVTSILLGLILAASFSLTGCQAGTEPEADTGDTVSSEVIESSAAQSEEGESAESEESESTESEPADREERESTDRGKRESVDEKADESEPASSTATESSIVPGEESPSVDKDDERVEERVSASSVVTETSVSQMENEVEASQPEQTVSDLRIIAEGVPVEVRLASDGQYSYEYDENEYAVTTAADGSAFEIKVTDISPGVDSGTNVVVYIPDQSYTLITGVSEGSSLILPAINANITVTGNASSVMLSLPSDYNKTLNYTGNASSCSLSMGGVNDFAVSAKISTSAVLVPSGWPAYDMLRSEYSYTSGNGTAKINIDVTSSSFTFG